jgi:hypothetical protein
MFLGMIWVASVKVVSITGRKRGWAFVSQRAQMNPVAVNAQVVPVDINSGGRLMSASPAMTSPHFMVGAQKKTVLGPAG